ncbi:MAG: glycoside hydrolase family 76 protein [Rhizonema sp. PD38]|nr:glycoside hydrolase family 76 protein [Rhizonema sp. PD38]
MRATGNYRARADVGIAVLQNFYNSSTGLWDTTGWWNGANALVTTIDHAVRTNTKIYLGNISNTFDKHKQSNFLNNFYDDEGWWALAWIKAYDLTGESRYLDMAKIIFNDMKGGWDSTCGGGIWWNKERKYKNAITNELFLSIAAQLHLRTPDDSASKSYLDWAQKEWNWFKNSGMINAQNLINDGLTQDCQNNGDVTWTYNQGVILGGLVDLYKSTNDSSKLTQAQAIADAAIGTLAPNGILREPCEPNCGGDGPQFKGIFIRNLYYLYQTTNKQTYADFITLNADSIWLHNRNPANQLGLSWAGAFDSADAARQSSAMDAINAAISFSTTGTTYQAENVTLHSLSTETIYNGYHGTGYLAGWTRDGQWVDFQVNVESGGMYDLVLRYAAAGGNASRYIYVNGNGVVNNQLFPGTDSWSSWNTVTVYAVPLNAGSNTVSVIFNSSLGSSNWLNLDEMTVQ